MSVQIGQKAPNLKVSKWVQGMDTNLDKQNDNIVVVEVFQVNCPGCFLHGIPEAINIYNKYHSEGVTVLGVATAFEDFDKNMAMAKRVMWLGGPELDSYLEETGLGNDPRITRVMVGFGKMISEDSLDNIPNPHGEPVKKTAAEIMYGKKTE